MNGLTNWKTTLAGLLGLIPTLLSVFGHGLDVNIASGIQAFALAAIGYLAHDAQPVK